MEIKQIGTTKSEARGYYFSMGNQGSNIELYSVWHQNDQKLTTIKRTLERATACKIKFM